MATNQPRDPRLAATLPPLYDPVFLERADSAVDEAARRAAAGADEGLLVWVGEQAAGRGQREAWRSPPGGLYAAVLLRPEFPAERLPELGLVSLLALGTAVAELLPPMTGLDYRWPNDLLINGHKVGGVAVHRPQADAAILATQLNVAPPVEGWEYASLVADGAAETTPGEALERYARYLLDWLQRWDEEGLAPVCQSLRARGLLSREEPITVHVAAGPVTGIPRGLEADGSLRLASDGTEKTVALADFFGR
ncbi:biotin--[acetyl-CoA-carboxylase] ligase [Spiribacter halobius]|nr:biotin/lipoate--protein ligase family protein [Spiribacter halobius]UEX78114.1 hypothetical protein LMH63_00295 [Spiribacter halobius]